MCRFAVPVVLRQKAWKRVRPGVTADVMQRNRSNLVLIGMPGVGKSTLGVLLAKASARDFVDTDVLLQRRESRNLQHILEQDGPLGFRALEEKAVLALHTTDTVIATGGSVVYSTSAMRHLQSAGRVVYLNLPLGLLMERLTNLGSRGVVRVPGQSMQDLYAERAPLYERWAEFTIDCSRKTHEELVEEILNTSRIQA